MIIERNNGERYYIGESHLVYSIGTILEGVHGNTSATETVVLTPIADFSDYETIEPFTHLWFQSAVDVMSPVLNAMDVDDLDKDCGYYVSLFEKKHGVRRVDGFDIFRTLSFWNDEPYNLRVYNPQK